MVVNAQVNQANKTTLRSARRSVVEKSLTGPTLLEMSGYPTYQELRFLPAKMKASSMEVLDKASD